MATPTPGSVPMLSVAFEGEAQLQWPNPSLNACLSFGHCPHLPRATMIAWWELPLHNVAAFYETIDCTYKSGSYTFNTKSQRSRVDGGHRFRPPQTIRSMKMGRNEATVLQERLEEASVLRSCDITKARDWYDKTMLDANETSRNTTYGIEWGSDAGSANWTDVLPDESDNSDSRSYDVEPAIAGN